MERNSISIEIPEPLQLATFVERQKRFIVVAKIGTEKVRTFLSHTGRLSSLLVPGATLVLNHVTPQRDSQLRFNVVAVFDGKIPVVVDTRLPNRLVLEGLKRGAFEEFANTDEVKAEVPALDRRIDFLLFGPQGTTYLEVKSCTFVERGIAFFPDAPSVRGTEQLRVLATLHSRGMRCAVLFLVARPDVSRFRPNRAIDPIFSEQLGRAHREGVRILAFSSSLMGNQFVIGKRLKLEIR